MQMRRAAHECLGKIQMQISGLNKTTLLDYPGCVAATIFTGGCNFRCPFCHNSGLVLTPFKEGIIPVEEVLSFLNKRKNILKGVCITGGEPTLQADLQDFMVRVKEMGYRVKLDTNGYQPETLGDLLEKGLLDYVAMDIKNCADKYAMTAGFYSGQSYTADANVNVSSGQSSRNAEFDLGRIKESVQILLSSRIEYEFRTTVVKELHTVEDIIKIGEWIKGAPAYYLQKFEDSGNVIGKGYHEPDSETLQEMVQVLSDIPELNEKVHLRGVY